MAKIHSLAVRKARGSMGGMTYSVVNGQQIVKEKAVNVKNPQTTAQMDQRVKLGNVINLYRLNKAWMEKYAFPLRPAKQSVYNAFVGANLTGSEVALTQEKYQQGVTILEPLDFTKGSLPQMLLEYDGSIPGFIADVVFPGAEEDDTIGTITQQLIENNSWLRDGDQLSVIFNSTDSQGLNPKMIAYEITLDSTSSVIWNSTDFGRHCLAYEGSNPNSLAFALDELPVGFMQEGSIVGAVFVVSRKTANGIEVTTSRMELNTYSLLNLYNSPAAKRAARRSYGSNDSAPFLVPGVTEGVGILHIESVNGLTPNPGTLLTQARNAAMTIVADGSFEEFSGSDITLDMDVAYESDDASEKLGGRVRLSDNLLTDPNVIITGNTMTIAAAAWAGKFPTTAEHTQGVDSVNPYSVKLVFNYEFSSEAEYKDIRSNP